MTNTRPIPLRIDPVSVTEDVEREWGRRHATGLLVGLAVSIAAIWVPVIAVCILLAIGR